MAADTAQDFRRSARTYGWNPGGGDRAGGARVGQLHTPGLTCGCLRQSSVVSRGSAGPHSRVGQGTSGVHQRGWVLERRRSADSRSRYRRKKTLGAPSRRCVCLNTASSGGDRSPEFDAGNVTSVTDGVWGRPYPSWQLKPRSPGKPAPPGTIEQPSVLLLVAEASDVTASGREAFSSGSGGARRLLKLMDRGA